MRKEVLRRLDIALALCKGGACRTTPCMKGSNHGETRCSGTTSEVMQQSHLTYPQERRGNNTRANIIVCDTRQPQPYSTSTAPKEPCRTSQDRTSLPVLLAVPGQQYEQRLESGNDSLRTCHKWPHGVLTHQAGRKSAARWSCRSGRPQRRRVQLGWPAFSEHKQNFNFVSMSPPSGEQTRETSSNSPDRKFIGHF